MSKWGRNSTPTDTDPEIVSMEAFHSILSLNFLNLLRSMRVLFLTISLEGSPEIIELFMW